MTPGDGDHVTFVIVLEHPLSIDWPGITRNAISGLLPVDHFVSVNCLRTRRLLIGRSNLDGLANRRNRRFSENIYRRQQYREKNQAVHDSLRVGGRDNRIEHLSNLLVTEWEKSLLSLVLMINARFIPISRSRHKMPVSQLVTEIAVFQDE
jgi:hypothetical protein